MKQKINIILYIKQKEISEYCNELRNKFFNSENVFKNYKYGINNLKSNYRNKCKNRKIKKRIK